LVAGSGFDFARRPIVSREPSFLPAVRLRAPFGVGGRFSTSGSNRREHKTKTHAGKNQTEKEVEEAIIGMPGKKILDSVPQKEATNAGKRKRKHEHENVPRPKTELGLRTAIVRLEVEICHMSDNFSGNQPRCSIAAFIPTITVFAYPMSHRPCSSGYLPSRASQPA
jgi:hypothetical protein